MIVIYAEKPDMAEKIAAVLGGNTFKKNERKQGYFNIRFQNREYAVTFGYGHLCGLSDASGYNTAYRNWNKMPIPFIPQSYKIIAKPNTISTVKLVHTLFSQAEYIINATDFDREGELIFYYLYAYLGCRKPIMRAKLASTTHNGIMEAFTNLLPPQKFAGLLTSARCRSIADWVVGCNLTAAMTLKCGGPGTVYSIGRVQTPTLSMVVARDEAIANFKPEDYFVLNAEFVTQNGEVYKGVHKSKRFHDRAEAETVLGRILQNKLPADNLPIGALKGNVSAVEKKESLKEPPLLYNLDTLQMDASGRYGISIKRTLDIAQRLYEKGLLTYPRTDSQFLPEDMIATVQNIQQMLCNNGWGNFFTREADPSNMLSNKKRYFDDSKIGSHYAIIPTEQPATGLTAEEQKIYNLVADSLVRILYPAAILARTKIETEVNGEFFYTTGTSVVDPGWMLVHGSVKEDLLPSLKEKESVDVTKCGIENKQTQPPKHYTDKTLLTAMVSAGKDLEDEELKKFMAENKIDGIGTVATRASILETLLGRGLVVRDKANILSTQRGRSLIHALPIEVLKSAELTAKYEKRLNLIVDGKDSANTFLSDIYKDVYSWCGQIAAIKQDTARQMSVAPNTNLMCPVCGSSLHRFKWGYGCSEYQNGCKFAVGQIAGKLLTEGQLKTLLCKEELGPLSGFKRKDGSSFSATLILKPVEENGKIVNYNIQFKTPESLQDEVSDLTVKCPHCGGKIIRTKFAWECENKCGISLPYILCGRKMEPELAEALFAMKSTNIIPGFISKKNKPFSAGLIVKGNKVEMFFQDRRERKQRKYA